MKLYIADDDIILVKGLRTIIERNCTDCEVIGEGHNGLQALEDMERLRPDLLITDIKMPVMDGVELVKKVGDLKCNIKVIVISGYDEYAYIRETLKHGAVDYLLKPVENNDLLELINKIKDDMEKENENRHKILLFNERVNESLSALKEKVLLDLIKGKSVNPVEIEGKLREYGISRLGIYAAAFIGIDEFCSNTNYYFKSPDSSAIRLIIQRIISGKANSIEVLETYMESSAVLLFMGDGTSEDGFNLNIINILEDAGTALEGEYDFTITAGISNDFYSIDGVFIGYQQAKLAFERRFYESKNRVLMYNPESCCYNYFDVKSLQRLLTDLIRSIEICDGKGARDTILGIFKTMGKDNIQPEQYREIWSYIINRVSDASQEFNEAAGQRSYNGTYLFPGIKSIDTLEELCEYILHEFSRIVETMNLLCSEKGKKIIEKSKDYIRQHFKEEISLTDLANHVHLNASYLSDLIKQETGQSFTSFLTEIRINEAKRLLAIPEVKVYEVGALIGYNEPVSFSRAFKRVVGISPQDYKKIAR